MAFGTQTIFVKNDRLTFMVKQGSLARAGKVKSQTPKVRCRISTKTVFTTYLLQLACVADTDYCLIPQVEPQEKKKTPKGRAKKRITYTRRFVNVTMTGGKRKVCLFLLNLH